MLTCADFAVLFYAPVVLSNSAVAMDVLRFGLPSVSAPSPPLELLTPDVSLKADSVQTLAEGIVRLATDYDLRVKLGAAAREKAEYFVAENAGAALDDLYEALWTNGAEEAA